MLLIIIRLFYFSIFLFSLFFFIKYNFYDIRVYYEIIIIIRNLININILLFIDNYCLIFIITVRLITIRVTIYCNYYIGDEKYLKRFIYLVRLFVISIYLLILRPNLISILLGWDGLGLISYLLVIYYQSNKSGNSGLLTVLSNRIGDVTLILSIRLSYYIYSWNYLNWDYVIFIISFLVVFTSFTKRAQLPFSAWLPAAIAAPTPVSSLVHSSTLVTAGIYFLIRFYILLPNSLLLFIIFSGTITIIRASLLAIFEIDYKKVIALSTLSQLGLIIMVLGSGLIYLCLFHLIIHALFKSSLFICTGIIIHSTISEQDKRYLYLNNLVRPWLMFSLSINNIALFGFFYLSGFFSKDIILEFIVSFNINYFLNFIIFFGTGCTLLYSLNFVLTSRSNIGENKFINFINNILKLNFIRLIPLLFGSVFIGYFYNIFIYNDLFILDIDIFIKYLVSLIISLVLLSVINLKKDLFNLHYKIIFFKFIYSLLFLTNLSVFFKIFLKISYLLLIEFKWIEILVNIKLNINLYTIYIYIQINLILKNFKLFWILIFLLLFIYIFSHILF